MKSCGVSLPAAARSLGAAAANDGEKMASGKATEIEEDFAKLTAREQETLVGMDRSVSAPRETCPHFVYLFHNKLRSRAPASH